MPMLQEGLDVIKAWGFWYRTCAFCWVKTNPNGQGIYSGLGHWTNGNAEICLFAKKGTPMRQEKNVKQVIIEEINDNLLIAPRGRHSAKPNEARNRIIRLIGDVPRIELFARERIAGWDYWGLEVSEEANGV
jgi:site-specific DNA-methyltransferase (adenine-specific)